MKKCRITVIKRSLNNDLAKEYGQSDFGLCPCFKEGDTFVTGFEQPEKFCGWAWNDIPVCVRVDGRRQFLLGSLCRMHEG